MDMINTLREKRANTWNAAKAFLDSKRGDNGLLSAEDTATYEKMEADVVALGKEIDRLERQNALDLALSKPTSNAITNKPAAPEDDSKKGIASNVYKGAFWNTMRGMQSLEIFNALKEGSDSEGGFLVPDEFERHLIEALEDENVFRKLAHVIRTSSGERKIPVVASKGEASWVDEEGMIPESDDAFGQVSIGSFKLATMIKVSEELINDSAFNLPAYITKEFARRVGNKEEDAFLNGNGIGKPLGVLADTGGGQIGVTTNSLTAVSFDDLMDLVFSLKSPYRRKAKFLLNDQTIKLLRKVKDANGQYLWNPSVKDGEPDTILNYPYHTSAFMPQVAAGAKAILFGDLSHYWVADRQGRIFKRLNELFAQTGQVGFLATQRVDGRLILPEAVKIMKMKTA